jgi:hypothetical protein
MSLVDRVIGLYCDVYKYDHPLLQSTLLTKNIMKILDFQTLLSTTELSLEEFYFIKSFLFK